MDTRILKYILRECRNAIHRTTRNAFAIATKVAFGTAFEIVTVVALSAGFCIGFTGCHTTKHITKTETQVVEEPAAPQWHTCLIQNAQAVVTLGDETMRANCTMQTVRDSMMVLSIMPMLGIEMLRIEATPAQVTGIDKINHRYAIATYDEINRYLAPSITWHDLQALATGELPTGDKEAFVGYTAGEQTIMLHLTYPERQLDVPVRTQAANLVRYQQIDIHTLLQ